MKPIHFSELAIGDKFEFATKTNVGCGKYNGVAIKTREGEYRFPCFIGRPEPTVLCLRVTQNNLSQQ